MRSERWFIPGAKPWTRRDEVTQRLKNCRAMLYMAWLALSSDSFAFAEVMLNVTRDEREAIITNVRKRGVRTDGNE